MNTSKRFSFDLNFSKKTKILKKIFFVKFILLFLFVLSIISVSTPQSFAGFCNVNNFINDSSSVGQRTCSSINGLVIENVQGIIYCSSSSSSINAYIFESLTITNSDIGFVNCQLRSATTGSDDITIENSNIYFYNSEFHTQSMQDAMFLEINSSSNNRFYSYQQRLFDIFIGPDFNPIIVNGNDLRRDFEIESLEVNFSSTNSFANIVPFVPRVFDSIDMFDIFLPEFVITNSLTNFTNEPYTLTLNLSNQESNLEFDYSSLNSLIDTPNEIILVDDRIPQIITAEFEYNFNLEQERIVFEFDEILEYLNVSIFNVNTGELLEEINLAATFGFIQDVSVFQEGQNLYEVIFSYSDFFENSATRSIIVRKPSINLSNSDFLDLNPFYIYNYSPSAVLNAELLLFPLTTPYINFLRFPITNSQLDALTIDNTTQILINNTNYIIPPSSSLFTQHGGGISTSRFATPPVLQLDNTTTIIPSTFNTINNQFEFEITSPTQRIDILNNTFIEITTSSPRLFNRPFLLTANLRNQIDNSNIFPSACIVGYNLETDNISVENMTYNLGASRFEYEILFSELMPLNKTIIVDCVNNLGFENISQEFIISQESQPISDFIFRLIYTPIGTGPGGAFTTEIKELGIDITSLGPENTDPITDNEYSFLISRVEFGRTGWNTTENLTSWINIGKNELITITHNDLVNSREIQIELENSTTLILNDSFVFRDERNEFNEGTSLFPIVRSCVPGNVCEFVSNSSEFFIFQDTTPPILFDFNIREITNNVNFEFLIDIDDLESDMDFAQLILTNYYDSNEEIVLDITNFQSNTTGSNNAPLNGLNFANQGQIYNLSIRSGNLNNLVGEIDLGRTLLIDNVPSENSTISLLNSPEIFNFNNRFYISNGSEVLFNLTAGVDNASFYEFNAGIHEYRIFVEGYTNSCNTFSQNVNNYSGSITDNENLVVTLNLSENLCNRVITQVIDRAGNIETLDTLEIIVDTTPPEFSPVQGSLLVAPIGSNVRFFNKWQITNSTPLFGYEFDVNDDLSPIRDIEIILYERPDNLTPFTNVANFTFFSNIKNVQFSLEDFDFIDGNQYKIGVIATNFANLSTQQINSSSNIFLSLTQRVEVDLKGLFRRDNSSIFYSPIFLDSGNYPILFENLNQAEISCSISDTQSNYQLSDPFQCSLQNDNSELLCNAPQLLIESTDSLFLNCFIDNSNLLAQRNFNFEYEIYRFNQSSVSELNLLEVNNRTSFLDNETIELFLNESLISNTASFIIQQTLIPTTSVLPITRLVIESKGNNVTPELLHEFNSFITPFSNGVYFNFSNSLDNQTEPFVELNFLNLTFNSGSDVNFSTRYQAIYTIHFHESINQIEIQELLNTFILEEQFLENSLEIDINIELSAPIENNLTLQDSNFSVIGGFNSEIIFTPYIETDLNSNRPRWEINSFDNFRYNLDLTKELANLNYESNNNFSLNLFNYFTTSRLEFNFDVNSSITNITIDNTTNRNLTVNPNEFIILDLNDYLNIGNSNMNIGFNLSTEVLSNSNSNLSIKPVSRVLIPPSNFSINQREDIILIYLNDSIEIENSTFRLLVQDSFESEVELEFNITWNPNQVNSNQFNTNLLPIFENNLVLNSTNFLRFNSLNNKYIFENIHVEFVHSSHEDLTFNTTTLDYTQVEPELNSVLIPENILQILYEEYIENSNDEVLVRYQYTSIFGFEFQREEVLQFQFDLNDNGVVDLNEDILYVEERMFDTSVLNITPSFNPSNTLESYFNISNNELNINVIVSWVDNNTNPWNFMFSRISIENKSFPNESLIGGNSISILNFPKFDSLKSVALTPLQASDDLVYCLGDHENSQVSNQCNAENEFILETCSSSSFEGSDISCVEENGLWKLLNLQNTIIETVCLEDWDTGAWSECVNGEQTRTVTANHNCGTSFTIPDSVRSCTPSTPPSSGDSTSSPPPSPGGGGGGGGGGLPPVSSTDDEDEIQIEEDDSISNNETIIEDTDDNQTQIPEIDDPITIVDLDDANETSNESSQQEDLGDGIRDDESTQLESDIISEIPQEASSTLWIFIVIIILLLLILVVAIAYYTTSKKNTSKSLSSSKNTKSSQNRDEIYSSIKKDVSNNSPSIETTSTNSSPIQTLTPLELVHSNKETMVQMLNSGTPLSQIFKSNNIQSNDQILESLRILGIDKYLQQLETEIRYNTTSHSAYDLISQIQHKSWFSSIKPSSNYNQYVSDLGFFITKYQITNIFNPDELKEIFLDAVKEDM